MVDTNGDNKQLIERTEAQLRAAFERGRPEPDPEREDAILAMLQRKERPSRMMKLREGWLTLTISRRRTFALGATALALILAVVFSGVFSTAPRPGNQPNPSMIAQQEEAEAQESETDLENGPLFDMDVAQTVPLAVVENLGQQEMDEMLRELAQILGEPS